MKLITENCHSEKKENLINIDVASRFMRFLSEEIEKNVRENLKGFFYGFIAFLIKM
jgi:hypothetical protein